MSGGVAPIAVIPAIDPLLPIAAIPQVAASAAHSVGAAFRVADLPPSVQQAFAKGAAFWREAMREAKTAGIDDPAKIADLIFFMQHPLRMTAGVGKPIDAGEAEFHELRADWELDFIIATKLLKPATTTDVFLPENRSSKYEEFLAKRTTGKVTMMIHGHNSDGTGTADPADGHFIGGFTDVLTTLDRMQETVESLGSGDFVYIANWLFWPTDVRPLTRPSSYGPSWGHLLAQKAGEGVKVRVIIAQHQRIPWSHKSLSPFEPNLEWFNPLILGLGDQSDNFKYLMSAHPDGMRALHHQKFMVAGKGSSTVAFCGGLDLGPVKVPRQWHVNRVWHDVAAKLEGLIAHDLERQFVELWNQDRDKSTAPLLAGWKPLEKLKLHAPSSADRAPSLNRHPVQMLRTVSVGVDPSDLKRDDIWRGYFRLIGRASRYIYLENQYFYQPDLADAIVKRVQSQPGMIVMVVTGTGSDDRQKVDPNDPTPIEQQKVEVDFNNNGFALRLEFFKRLFPLYPTHLRVYTMNYEVGVLHTKLIMVDDEALTVGSANANGRGFFLDTEVNFMLDHAETVRDFRNRLWGHNLGIEPGKVDAWAIGEFFRRWDEVAEKNRSVSLQAKPSPAAKPDLTLLPKMKGEGVIPFFPLAKPGDRNHDFDRYREGKRGPVLGTDLPDRMF